jgi:CheY-like chemotaxis protein
VAAPRTSNRPKAVQKGPDAAQPRSSTIDDDRERLVSTQQLLLVVEDDERFARILYDMAHQQNFQCIVSASADEGSELAERFTPSAVILDVGLPDHSGLSVLDRLKHNPRTRHIPVHVISAEDFSETAYSLGAISYMLKPVKREDLLETFTQLEQRVTQQMRRVLVVEDDKVQRESIQKLLGSPGVTTVGVGTAAECLQALSNDTFDCMVLDISLPDESGYSLLETLSHDDAYSFPPVIVYTGRDLSSVQEQQLRRYSKSIIIKGAKSPERLLDEVTLFLHQVVTELPPEHQNMLKKARNRDAVLEGRRILVVEDDIRNIYSISNILEPRGATVQIARNGKEALEALEKSKEAPSKAIDLVLMDVMMPEMDGITATRTLRTQAEWKKLPVIMLTAKAMRNDQEQCLAAGANDYMAKPIDVDKLLSLVRVWMPR